MDNWVCWHCGVALTDVPLPLARAAACPACRHDLHVCRACLYYDTGVARSCREPVAEDVHDKTRANFCGYYQPCPDAYRPADAAVQQASMTGLAALFGETPSTPDRETPDQQSESADRARARLEALFGSETKPD